MDMREREGDEGAKFWMERRRLRGLCRSSLVLDRLRLRLGLKWLLRLLRWRLHGLLLLWLTLDWPVVVGGIPVHRRPLCLGVHGHGSVRGARWPGRRGGIGVVVLFEGEERGESSLIGGLRRALALISAAKLSLWTDGLLGRMLARRSPQLTWRRESALRSLLESWRLLVVVSANAVHPGERECALPDCG